MILDNFKSWLFKIVQTGGLHIFFILVFQYLNFERYNLKLFHLELLKLKLVKF